MTLQEVAGALVYAGQPRWLWILQDAKVAGATLKDYQDNATDVAKR